MQTRVAMGRAIVRQPQVFRMDEPLSNLDAKLRVSTRTQIAALQRRPGTTTVDVTRDQVEAMTMGHRVTALEDGVLQQCDTPLALYDRPADLFVVSFVGSPAMNLIKATSNGECTASLGGYHVPLQREVVGRASGGNVTLGIRPEGWRLAGEGGDGYKVQVAVVEELGADSYI